MVLTTLLSPPVRRAVRGLLGPRVVLTDELPPDDSPRALALVQGRDAMSPLTRNLTVLSHNVRRCEDGRVKAPLERAVDDHHPDVILLEDSGFSKALAGRRRALDTCLARGHLGFVRTQTTPLGGSDHQPLIVAVAL